MTSVGGRVHPAAARWERLWGRRECPLQWRAEGYALSLRQRQVSLQCSLPAGR